MSNIRPHEVIFRRGAQPLFDGEPFPYAIALTPEPCVEWDGRGIIKLHLTIYMDVGGVVIMNPHDVEPTPDLPDSNVYNFEEAVIKPDHSP